MDSVKEERNRNTGTVKISHDKSITQLQGVNTNRLQKSNDIPPLRNNLTYGTSTTPKSKQFSPSHTIDVRNDHYDWRW